MKIIRSMNTDHYSFAHTSLQLVLSRTIIDATSQEKLEHTIVVCPFEKIDENLCLLSMEAEYTIDNPMVGNCCEYNWVAKPNSYVRRLFSDTFMFGTYSKTSSNVGTTHTISSDSGESIQLHTLTQNYQKDETNILHNFDLQQHESHGNASLCTLPLNQSTKIAYMISSSIYINCELLKERIDEYVHLYIWPDAHFEHKQFILDSNHDKHNETCTFEHNTQCTVNCNLNKLRQNEIIDIFIHDIIIVSIAVMVSDNILLIRGRNESPLYQSEVQNSGVFLMRRSQSIGANYSFPDEEYSKRTLNIDAISLSSEQSDEKCPIMPSAENVDTNIIIAAGSVHGLADSFLQETLWCEAIFVPIDLKQRKSPLLDISVEARPEHESIGAHIEIVDRRKTIVHRCFIAIESDDTKRPASSIDDCRQSIAASSLSLANSERSLPDLIDIPNYSIKQFSTATITCELYSDLEHATIVWYKGKQPLHMIPDKIRRISQQNVETLIIANVQPSDSDLYSVYSDSLLFPVAFLIVEETQIECANYLETTFVMEGQAVALLVTLSQQDSNRYITWFKENDEIVENDRIKVDNDGFYYRLTIENVTMQDQAKYMIKTGATTYSINLIVEPRVIM
jgi:hypothetical protein